MCFKKKNNKYMKCPLCRGKGYTGIIIHEKCPRCEGDKKVLKSEDESKTCGTCGGRLD